MSLCEIALKYGTDKCPQLGPPQRPGHSYTPFYADLLKDRKVNRLLEIGIEEGASLRMWRDYFPEARIIGLDIIPSRIFHEGMISTYLCDSSNKYLLRDIGHIYGTFDVVLDDGDHYPEHQIIAAEALLPYVTAGGVYIIEDVKEDAAEQVMMALEKHSPKLFEFNKDFITKDDRVIILER